MNSSEEKHQAIFDEWIRIAKNRIAVLEKENPDKKVKLNFIPLQKSFGWEIDFELVPKTVKENENN